MSAQSANQRPHSTRYQSKQKERPKMHPRVLQVIKEWEGYKHFSMTALWEDSRRCVGPHGDLIVVLNTNSYGPPEVLRKRNKSIKATVRIKSESG